MLKTIISKGNLCFHLFEWFSFLLGHPVEINVHGALTTLQFFHVEFLCVPHDYRMLDSPKRCMVGVWASLDPFVWKMDAFRCPIWNTNQICKIWGNCLLTSSVTKGCLKKCEYFLQTFWKHRQLCWHAGVNLFRTL